MLEGILSISGQGGLFKMVSQAKNSIIVESLVDGKRMPAYATSRISALEDISVFTEEGDKKLEEIFEAIYKKEDGGKAINPKSSASELKEYFEFVLPDYDRDRVYVSDIKKILAWYNLLNEQGMLDFTEKEEAEAEQAAEKDDNSAAEKAE